MTNRVVEFGSRFLRFRQIRTVVPFFSCAILLAFSVPSQADTPPTPPSTISPLTTVPDVNGVNIADGMKNVDLPVVLSTPADPRLTFDKVQNSAPYIDGTINNNCIGQTCTLGASSWSAHLGRDESASFQCGNDDVCHSVRHTGATFDFGSHNVQEAGTGAVYGFNQQQSYSAPPGQSVTEQDYAAAITYPDGEVISFTYDENGYNSLNPGLKYFRPTQISSNTGYYITIIYQYTGEDISQNPTGWETPAQAALYAPGGTLIRRIVYNSDGTIHDYGNSATNTGGRTFTTTVSNALGDNLEQSSGLVQLPGESSAELTVNAASFSGVVTQPISSVVRDGVTWNYAYANPRAVTTIIGGTYTSYDSVTVSGPNGYSLIYQITYGDKNYITSSTDALSHTTNYTYDPNEGFRLTGITLPEGNSVSLVYDGCGNIISKTTTEKPSAGTATLTESATFATVPGAPDGSESQCPNVSAYLPLTHTDALNGITNFAYNSGGQLTKELDPADQSNVQRLTYVQYANSASGISRKSEEQICKSSTTNIGTAACSGNAASHTEYTYWNNTALPLTVIQKDEATNTTRTTTYGYDADGRVTMIDGPLSGTDDAKYFQYDIYGRKTWEVGERGPNGLRIAKNYTYRDSDDKVTSVQTGTVNCTSGCDTASLTLTLLQQTDTTYDSRRYAVRDQVSKNGTIDSVTDASFLDRGLAECTTVRMNLTSLPATSDHGACSLGTQGSQGADRITKNFYDSAGQVIQIRTGVGTGTGSEFAKATYSYTPNGKQLDVIDADGTHAEFVYDGFDRLYEWQFPSTTPPSSFNDSSQSTALSTAGTVNTADYEQYTYDGAGNRTCFKKRDGSKLTYTFDGLNRVTSKVVAATSGGTCP